MSEKYSRQYGVVNGDLIQARDNTIESLKKEVGELKSELLKAKERFCQCQPKDKHGSTSAMHCNLCGNIEQTETWLK